MFARVTAAVTKRHGCSSVPLLLLLYFTKNVQAIVHQDLISRGFSGLFVDVKQQD